MKEKTEQKKNSEMHETRELCCLLLDCIRGQRAVVQPLVSGWVVFVRNHRDRGRDEGAHGATMQTRRRSRMENIRARGAERRKNRKENGEKKGFFLSFFLVFSWSDLAAELKTVHWCVTVDSDC